MPILEIFEEMFKQEFNVELIKAIIVRIDNSLQEKQKNGIKTTLTDVIDNIMEIWASEITSILKMRKEKSI